jgi:signal peptidase I
MYSRTTNALKRGMLIIFVIVVASALGFQLAPRVSPWVKEVGRSMEPTLQNGDIRPVRHRVDKNLSRGSVVVVARWGGMPSVKRVVGLPGETMTFIDGEVFINDQMLAEPYLSRGQTTFCWETRELKAGPNQVNRPG